MNTARPTLTDQELLDRITSQSWLPDGDFTNFLPYPILYHLIMEFPKLSHDARDIMVTVLMHDRIGLYEFFGGETKESDDAYEQVAYCLDMLKIMVEFAKETLERLSCMHDLERDYREGRIK